MHAGPHLHSRFVIKIYPNLGKVYFAQIGLSSRVKRTMGGQGMLTQALQESTHLQKQVFTLQELVVLNLSA
jgi:hypothetical protein